MSGSRSPMDSALGLKPGENKSCVPPVVELSVMVLFASNPMVNDSFHVPPDPLRTIAPLLLVMLLVEELRLLPRLFKLLVKANVPVPPGIVCVLSVPTPVRLSESSTEIPDPCTPLPVPSERMSKLSVPKALAAVTSPEPPPVPSSVQLEPL